MALRARCRRDASVGADAGFASAERVIDLSSVKMTDGFRATWAASGEAAIRTAIDTARLSGASPFATILDAVGA